MADDLNDVTDDDEVSESSEALIAVHWRDEGYYPPPPSFVAQANASDPAIREQFTEDKFPDSFTAYADLLTWFKRWDTVLDTSNAPFWKWFVGGELNASYNCVDRHLADKANKAALIWVPEPESEAHQAITYRELYVRVNEFAAVLKSLGLKAGDRITFHMPMVPELPVAMLAAARLGIVHSQVFAGFSGTAAGHRIADSGSTVLVTIDGYYRSGELLDHKVKADEAVEAAAKEGQQVDKVLVFRRYPGQYSAKTPMVEGRDVFVDDLLAEHKGELVEPARLQATDPLFLMYTCGTTGRPKGCQHSIGGYLSYVAGTSKYYQDIHPDDTYWCLADIGWITGHSYIVYGPLALGTTSVIYEGTPNYPDAARPWRIAVQLGVNIFHTSPTSIRMLRKVGPDEPAKYDYHFKHMTTVGEPIEPEVWRWYYESVGKGEAVIVDTWWQTETGGFLGSTLPGIDPAKPGSCGPAALGILPAILDEDGNEVPGGQRQGGQHRHPQPVAGRLPDDLGPARAVRLDLLRQVQQGPEVHRLARLALLRRRRRHPGGRRLLPDPRPRRRRDQRGGPPARHQGTRVGRAHGQRGRRGGRGPGRRRRPRPGGRDVHLAQARLRRLARRSRPRSGTRS